MKSSSKTEAVRGYPIADAIPPEELEAEVAKLERLERSPVPHRFWSYIRLGGPGFLDAATTLGAGTLTAAMLSGAAFLSGTDSSGSLGYPWASAFL